MVWNAGKPQYSGRSGDGSVSGSGHCCRLVWGQFFRYFRISEHCVFDGLELSVDELLRDAPFQVTLKKSPQGRFLFGKAPNLNRE